VFSRNGNGSLGVFLGLSLFPPQLMKNCCKEECLRETMWFG
jgi:hypothetical protein